MQLATRLRQLFSPLTHPVWRCHKCSTEPMMSRGSCTDEGIVESSAIKRAPTSFQ